MSLIAGYDAAVSHDNDAFDDLWDMSERQEPDDSKDTTGTNEIDYGTSIFVLNSGASHHFCGSLITEVVVQIS